MEVEDQLGSYMIVQAKVVESLGYNNNSKADREK